MAKIALIFLIFALFAMCMAGRITRDEPSTPSPIESLLVKFAQQTKDFFNEENGKKWLSNIQNVTVEGMKQLTDASNQFVKSIQAKNTPNTK